MKTWVTTLFSFELLKNLAILTNALPENSHNEYDFEDVIDWLVLLRYIPNMNSLNLYIPKVMGPCRY